VSFAVVTSVLAIVICARSRGNESGSDGGTEVTSEGIVQGCRGCAQMVAKKRCGHSFSRSKGRRFASRCGSEQAYSDASPTNYLIGRLELSGGVALSFDSTCGSRRDKIFSTSLSVRFVLRRSAISLAVSPARK
jgi:hypothetical protein